MRVRLKVVLVALLSLFTGQVAVGQLNLPGFGTKNVASNDQKASALLHEHLPLVLDANTAYPTVPDGDLLGGPFHGHNLPITLDTLTKPLPPGDYVLPMTFFCSEYSIHRPGAGTAYVLAPARGTAAKAISTLLWRGMLTGHKPQELQSVSWAIQGSVAYDKMPASYKKLVDELIPDMKNQVNGQAFTEIEDGFQGKVNRFTRKVSEKATEGLGKVTGGRGRVDIKVDVELNQSFGHLGRLGQMALDGESISNIVQAANLTDAQREQALYAGQGTQAPPLAAANGPWSVMVPGVAYMRFVVHGGNLQNDNLMQIRIRQPERSTIDPAVEPHFALVQYEQSTPTRPSLGSLLNGHVNQAALSQCLQTSMPQNMCVAGSLDVGGLSAYSVGSGAQSPIVAPAGPSSPSSDTEKVCVRKVIYQPAYIPPFTMKDGQHQFESVGLCIFLAVVKSDGSSCEGQETATVPSEKKLNWVQTYSTNYDPGHCTPNKPHKDECKDNKPKPSPLYRPGPDNKIFEAPYAGFETWRSTLSGSIGNTELLFRDLPNRTPTNPAITRERFVWGTAAEDDPPSSDSKDNDLRLVAYTEGQDAKYTPLIHIRYGWHIGLKGKYVSLDPLYIGSNPEPIDNGGGISIGRLKREYDALPSACKNTDADKLGDPPSSPITFVYDRSGNP